MALFAFRKIVYYLGEVRLKHSKDFGDNSSEMQK